MTYAPARILEVRHFLAPLTGLPATSLGIVGDVAHAERGTSYHLGRDQLTSDAYSRQTARDRAGLTNAASALDIGNFPGLRALSLELVKACQRDAVGTRDIREIIYSPDGTIVLRWDRERGFASQPQLMPSTALNNSHRFHTHISWYRDSEKRDKVAVFRAVVAGDTAGQEDDVPLVDFTLATDELGGTIKVKEGGATVVTIDGGDRPVLPAGMVRPTLGPVFLAIRGELKHYIVFIGTTEIGFVNENEVEFTPTAAAGPHTHSVTVSHPPATVEVDGKPVIDGKVVL